MSDKMKKWIWLAAFIACVPVANWMIGNVGAKCIPNGPCLIRALSPLPAPGGTVD